MAQYFLGDNGDSLDSVSPEMMAQLLEEAQRVVAGAGSSGRDVSPRGTPCHPALDIDWSEGDAGFVDWLSERPPPSNGFAA